MNATSEPNEPSMAFLEPNRTASGSPPDWTTTPREAGERRSYFEGSSGDQWIASATEARFLLTGGDIGWRTIRVDDPKYEMLLGELAAYQMWSGFQGIVFAVAERQWLTAVLLAAMDAKR